YSLAPGTLSEPPPMELVRGKRPTVKPRAFLVLTCALLAAAAAAWWFERLASPEKFEPDGSGKPGAGRQAPQLATLHPRPPGKRVDAGPLRLSRGATLAGRVRCGGVSRDKITVIATWYGTTKEGTRPAADGHLWIEDGRAIWSQVETHPDDDGRFRISGLEDSPYRLRVRAADL